MRYNSVICDYVILLMSCPPTTYHRWISFLFDGSSKEAEADISQEYEVENDNGRVPRLALVIPRTVVKYLEKCELEREYNHHYHYREQQHCVPDEPEIKNQ